MASTSQSIDSDLIIERPNPYNDNYTEYFLTSVCSTRYTGDKGTDFNHIKYDGSYFYANYYSMNVSAENFKVFIAHCSGKLYAKSFVPMYLKYFNVELYDGLRIYIVFPSKDEQYDQPVSAFRKISLSD